MAHEPSAFLTPWAAFYTMTGSATAALIGLMFVVITLVTGAQRGRSREGTAAFNTPTVVHFGGALLVSAILAAPWRSLLYVAVMLGLMGLCGALYVLRVAYRIKRMDAYTADTEDWVWHTLLPFLAYGTILAAALTLQAFTVPALFAIAGAVVTMLFIGIHNAWDIVTFIALRSAEEPPSPTEEDLH